MIWGNLGENLKKLVQVIQQNIKNYHNFIWTCNLTELWWIIQDTNWSAWPYCLSDQGSYNSNTVKPCEVIQSYDSWLLIRCHYNYEIFVILWHESQMPQIRILHHISFIARNVALNCFLMLCIIGWQQINHWWFLWT